MLQVYHGMISQKSNLACFAHVATQTKSFLKLNMPVNFSAKKIFESLHPKHRQEQSD